MSGAGLPEIREVEATGETAAIYAGLRAAIGIPLVNLIWRHFATLPGVLPWVWEAIRVPAGSAALRQGRASLAEAGRGGALSARLATALAGRIPLAVAEERAIVALIDAYNRGNATNLLLLTALRRHLAGDVVSDAAGLEPSREVGGIAAVAETPAALPPIPRLDGLAPEIAAAVRALAGLHGAEAGGVVPSLWLHLALWPATLTPLHAALSPAFAEGVVARARDAACAEAEATAPALLARMRVTSPFPEAQRSATLAALGIFTGQVIPSMTAIGLALRTAWAPGVR